jgi:biotin transport system ATP-binding protein
MINPLIQIEDLSHSYPDGKNGISDITLSITKGEFIILSGRNGSGKTTLIKHLNGLLHPSSGRILLYNKSIFKNLQNTRKKIGMVFQDADTQIVGDTVFDEVSFGPENLKMPRAAIKKKVTKVLEDFGLDRFQDRNPSTLSGGEKRKLAIAGALVMDPDIIIFDEPFSNLDYPGTLSVLDTIIALNRSGHTIIVATHDIETVIAQATRLIIMEQGRIKADDKPETLVKRLEQFGIREPCSTRFGLGIQSWQN